MLTLWGRIIVLTLFFWWQGLLVISVVTGTGPAWIFWVGSASCSLIGLIGAIAYVRPSGIVAMLIYGESMRRGEFAKELMIGSAWTSLSVAAIAVHLSMMGG